MTLACQFQHLLAEPIPILPDPVTTQPPARAGAVGAGFNLPVPVLAEPYHIEDAREWLNRMTDGEAREGTHSKREPVAGPTLAAGNSICAGGGVEVADTPGERGATTCVSASGKGEAARRPESALDQTSGTNAGNIVRTAEIVASRDSVLPARINLAWASVQLPESAYLETICGAIECADEPEEFRVIRAAIAKVRGTVNQQSLRMMVELREQEVA